jgi:hypothetical protein
MREWKVNTNWYSAPILSNGYLFYFFLQPQFSEVFGKNILAGLVRCNSVGGRKHHLPLQITITFADNKIDGGWRTISKVK